MGKFSFTFLAALDKASIEKKHLLSSSIWCLIDLDELANAKGTNQDIYEIVSVLLKQPQTRILYHYRTAQVTLPSMPLSERELLLRLPPHLSQSQSGRAVVEIVRPDGIVMFESSDIAYRDFDRVIAENFYFVKGYGYIDPNDLEVEYENIC